MYDKLKLYCPRTKGMPDVVQYLDAAKEQTDLNTGEVCTFGSVGGMRVGVYTGGVSIVGSLAKYRYGNNIASLNRNDTAQAVAMLSDALHLDLSSALVSGMEFGTNFAMSKPVGVYLRKLRDVSKMIRNDIKDGTLYYKSRGVKQSKVLCFYDKIHQTRIDKMPVPDELSDAHLLRYELRLNGRLKQQLNAPEVLASTLSEKDFYKRLVRLWQSNYFAISKTIKPTLDDMSRIKSVSDAYNVLVARLISQSDPNQISEFIAELKDANTFDNRVYYTRLKQKIDAVVGSACLSVDDDIKELDNGVKNAGMYI